MANDTGQSRPGEGWRSWVPPHIGRYELVGRLATGGMGEVFIAKLSTGVGAFEKRVALKLLLPHLCDDPRFVQMFLDEARIAARMEHPNIVQIFDQGEADGRYFLTMTLVRGVSLSDVLDRALERGEALPLAFVGAVAAGLCDGLSYAHGLRTASGDPDPVIHRDVSPSNVLVSSNGGVLLTDFGVAKARDNLHRTATGQQIGKYPYMSPEQVEGKPVDHRADVFSAAVTLYEALTGVSPFERDGELATMEAVRREEVADVRTLRPEIPESVAHAMARALSKDPNDRFADILELKRALGALPSARSEEMAAVLQRLCADRLARFDPAPRPLQATVATGGDAPAPALLSRHPKAVGAAAAAGLLVLIAVFTLVFRHRSAPSTPADPPRAEVPVTMVAPVEGPPTPSAVAVVTPPASAPVARTVPVQPPPRKRERRKAATRMAPDSRPSMAKVPVGYVTANAKPWAAVYLGNKEIDRTPMSRYPFPVGEHVLVFKNPQLGRELRRTVKVTEGKIVTLEVDLEK